MNKRMLLAAPLAVLALGPMVGQVSGTITPTPAHAVDTVDPVVAQMTHDLTRLDNVTLGTSLLTPWNTEVKSATEKHGFAIVEKARVSQTPKAGLVGIHRLYNPNTNDFVWIVDGTAELANATAKYGYVDQGINFYAMKNQASGARPVYRVLKGNRHQYVFTSAERDKRLADGWLEGHVAFYVAPATTSPTTPTTPSTTSPSVPVSSGLGVDLTRRLGQNTNPAGDADGKFSFAVMPDTQKTSTHSGFTDFAARADWLIANKASSDLRFVTHNGDITNWGERLPEQYANAMKGFTPLTAAGIPWSVSLGNHDTGAVGWDGVAGSTNYGGAAYVGNPLCHTDASVQNNAELVKMAQEKYGKSDPCITQVLVRETTDFNSFFKTSDMGMVEGAYEVNKADNTFSTFEAAGKKWLMLNTEFVPRAGVLNWMENVVKAHPDHNVIIVTHSYIDGYGNIITSAEYGETSGKMIEDRIVSKYSNVKAVFSGHVGSSAQKTYTYGTRKVPAFLQTLHPSGGQAPTRMVEVDIQRGVISTKIVEAKSGAVTDIQSISGLSFV